MMLFHHWDAYFGSWKGVKKKKEAKKGQSQKENRGRTKQGDTILVGDGKRKPWVKKPNNSKVNK